MSTRQRLVVWGKRAVFALGILAALYLVAANALLLGPWGERLLSRRPDRFHIAWSSAWSLWPGQVRLRGVELGGGNAETTWTVKIQRAAVSVDLSDLFSRQVRIARLSVAGVAATTEPRGPSLEAAPRLRKPWSVVCDQATISEIETLDFSGLRIEGQGSARGAFRLVGGDTFELTGSKLDFSETRLTLEGRELVRKLSLAVEARIAPFDAKRQRGAERLDLVSGSVTADAELTAAELAADAPGRLSARLQVDQGAIGAGSLVTVEAGELALRLAAEPSRLLLTGTAANFALGPVSVGSVSLNAATREARLSRWLAEAGSPGAEAAPPRLDARLEAKDVAWKDWRLAGSLAAQGSLGLSTGNFAVHDLDVQLAGGRLERAQTALADHLDAHVTAALVAPAPLAQALDELSAALTLSGRFAPPESLRRRLPDGGRGGQGTFAARLELAKGRLAPGSTVEVTAGKHLTASAKASERGLALKAQGRELVLPGAASSLTLDRVTFAAATPELQLSKLAAQARERNTTALSTAADVEALGVRWQGGATRLSQATSLKRVSAKLDLAALQRRQIVLSRLTGEDLTIRFATRQPGLEAVSAESAAAASAWSFTAPDARVGLTELSWDDRRLSGPATATVSLSWSPRRGLSVPKARLSLPNGKLTERGGTVAGSLALEVRLTLDPFLPRAAGTEDLLRHLTATGEVSGRVSSLGFLERYTKRAQMLDLGGAGELSAKLDLRHGRLAAGTRIDVAGADVRASYLDYRATGSARITGRVERVEGNPGADHALVKVEFDRFDIARLPAEGAPRLVHGRGLALSATSPDVDLTQPVRSLTAEVVLAEGTVPDLSVYNRFLPAGIGVGIAAGRGTVGFRLRLDPIARTGDGEVNLRAEGVTAQFADLELDGELAVRAALKSSDLLARRFDLAGTRLTVSGITVRRPGVEEERPLVAPGWWARLDFERGDAVWSSPLAVSGAARLEMRDPGLLVALFSERRATLGWLIDILDVQNVVAQGEIRLANGSLSIDPLSAATGRLDLRSRLLFGAGSRRGDLLVRWRRLAAGIELRDGERRWHLRRPVEWFENSQLGDQ